MQHPGPPRFLAVGESVQLAPRDPDPAATYDWWICSAPGVSTLELPDRTPVIEFEPDAAGTYGLRLETPDRTHTLTVRAFADVRFSDRDTVKSGGTAGSGDQSGSPGLERSGDAPDSGSGRPADSVVGDRPRLQLHGAVEGDEVVVRADPTFPDDADEGEVEFLVDDRDDIDPTAVAARGRELRIPVAAVGDRVRVHAAAVAGAYSVPDTVDFTRIALPDGTIAERKGGETADGVAVDTERKTFEIRRPNDPPEWAEGITVYEVYIRGFAGSDVEDGSVFAATEERLDYLADLGVDCLWLTPVLENDHAPHGYNITDFFSIAADLGDREDYESFVDAAHDRGMAVLFDLVMNHSARDHPFFQNAYNNPDAEYYDWYDWQENGEPKTYFEWEYIANWNFESLEARQHLLDAVDTWFEVADGFRCDMAWAVPDTFWQELRDRVKARDPEFLLLDETIPYVPDFHNVMFDVHFDTTLYFTLRQVGRGHVPAEAILDAVDGRAEVGFPPHASFLLYIENHDETRYLVECGEDAAFAAAGALFTLPGVPMIYGGQELGQRGRRDALAWDDTREAFYDHYEGLVDLRESTPELRGDASLARVTHETDTERAVAFARASESGTVVCVLNFDQAPATVQLGRAVDPTDLVSGASLATDDGLEVDDIAVFRAE